ARRITRSVRELRRHLPDSMPLSGLSICAVADRVVVREGGSRWQADSGQYLLAFEGDPAAGAMSVVSAGTSGKKPPAGSRVSAEEWFDRGAALEDHDNRAAIEAYEQAIAAAPSFIKAHLNLGGLLHDMGRHAEAERAYRNGVQACGDDPTLLF